MGEFSTRDSASVEGMMNGCREPHGASPQPIRSEITAAAAAQNLPGGCCKWYAAQFPECNWPLHATEGDTNIKAEREKQASDNLGFFFTLPFYGCSQVSDTFDKSCTSTVVLV